VQLFGGNGKMLNAVDDERWTPLHYSAAKGHISTCQLLLSFRADLHGMARSWKNQETPLDLALKNQHLLVAEMLNSCVDSSNQTATLIGRTQRSGRWLPTPALPPNLASAPRLGRQREININSLAELALLDPLARNRMKEKKTHGFRSAAQSVLTVSAMKYTSKQ